MRRHAGRADDQHFARLDVAHVRRADQVERAGLGADDHPGIAEAAECTADGSRADRARRSAHPSSACTSEKAPRTCSIAFDDRAISAWPPSTARSRWTMTSVSVVVWKMEPWRTSRSLAVRCAFTRLPLWPMASWPCAAVDEERLRVLEAAGAGGRGSGRGRSRRRR